MPMYDYVDKKTKVEVTVLRSFNEYKTVPTREEVGDKMTDEQYADAEWERTIGGHQSVVRGAGWGQKGYWLLLICCTSPLLAELARGYWL